MRSTSPTVRRRGLHRGALLNLIIRLRGLHVLDSLAYPGGTSEGQRVVLSLQRLPPRNK